MAYAARSHLAQSALVDGSAGIVLLHDGRVAVALRLEIEAEKITRIWLFPIADSSRSWTSFFLLSSKVHPKELRSHDLPGSGSI
jgi:hypothetical protein